MRCLVDAHLPRRFVYLLRNAGHDALHTLDLPDGNRTPDRETARLADEHPRIVVTEDEDDARRASLTGTPRRYAA